MKNVKTICILIFIISIVFLSACSKSAEQPTPEPEPAEQELIGQNDEQEEPTEPEEPIIDMKGEPIKILTWREPPNDETEEGALRVQRQKEVEEKYNTKIEWVIVPWGENFNMVAQTGLSGESVADIVFLDLYHAIPLVNQGLLQPIDDFFDFDDPKWPKGIKTFGNINGKMYGFADYIFGGAGIYYNKTLLQREGLEDPHELMKKGEWTWDKWLEMMIAATKDTDGDGVTDQWGFTNHAPILSRLLIYANGGTMLDYRDGKWEFTAHEPKAIEALEFMHQLFHTHKVIAPNEHMSMEDYNQSQAVFDAGKALFLTGETTQGKYHVTMEDEMGFVLFPKGPSATNEDYKSAIENFKIFYMPTNSKHAREAAIIWQDLILWERIDDAKRTEAELQLVAGPEDVDAIVAASDYLVPIFFPGGTGFTEAIWSIAVDKETPQSAIEKIVQQAQGIIDDNYNVAP